MLRKDLTDDGCQGGVLNRINESFGVNVSREMMRDACSVEGDNRLSIIAVLSDCGCSWRLEDVRTTVLRLSDGCMICSKAPFGIGPCPNPDRLGPSKLTARSV